MNNELLTQVDDLRTQTPSGPDFTQSTIGYTNKSIDVAVSALTEMLSDHTELDSLLENLSAARFMQVPIKHSFFKRNEQGALVIADNVGRILVSEPNMLLNALAQIDPELGAGEYILPLQKRGSNSYQRTQSYPQFNERFESIIGQTETTIDHPHNQIIALALLTQVAKNAAVDEAHTILKRVRNAAEPAGVIDPTSFITAIKQKVFLIRHDQAFISKCQQIINAIAENAHINSDQLQVLMDIAFMDENLGIDGTKNVPVLRPILEHVTANQWDRAFAHRDFLLQYLADIFPQWRGRENKKQFEGHVYRNFAELYNAISSGKVNLSADDIPESFRTILFDAIQNKTEHDHGEEQKHVLNSTLPVSRNLLRRLAITDQENAWDIMLRARFGDSANEINTILRDSFSVDYDTAKNAYVQIFIEKNLPGILGYAPTITFNHLRAKLLAMYEVASRGNMCELYTPQHRRIEQLELVNDKHQIICKDLVKPVNFGKVLDQIITYAVSQDPTQIRGVGNINTLRQIIMDAFAETVASQPDVQNFTVEQYLYALLESADSEIDHEYIGLLLNPVS